MEIKDGIILKLARRRVNVNELKASFAKHINVLKNVEGRIEPKPGELCEAYLEEEFE